MKQLIRNILPFTFTAILFAACTDELPVERTQQQYYFDGDYYFVLEDENASMSRVLYDGITHAEFSTGDRIGVFAPQNKDTTQIPNDVFSARDISKEPPSGPHQVLVPADDQIKKEIPKKENEYLLYFPYSATRSLAGLSNGSMSHTIKEDQSVQSNLTESDLLWCHKLMSDEEKEAQYVTIHMHHAMATIVVTVAKDSVDTTHDVILPSMPTNAKGIILRKEDEEVTTDNLLYTVDTENSRKDISMYKLPDDTDEYNYVYRAVVPACQTLSKDSDILTLYLKNKKGEYVETTYKLAQDVSLRPGKYYTFNLRSGQKPAIPDVGEDDSWVLDVFDPETNQLVGLLCREYLHFQPDQTDDFSKDKETGTDAAARDQNGNPTKNINSQAWVFYSLQEDGKTPELSEGIAMRFVYDILYMSGYSGYSERGVSTWPLPHHKPGIGQVQQIILSVAHGHNWIDMNDGNGYYGADSRDYKEFYLHGAKIVWDGLNNKIADVQLRREGISDPNGITNIEAALYGHIAIPKDGSAPYVSYTPASDDNDIDMDGAKIGVLIPRTLHDSRIGTDGTIINKEYPIVKIGFNQFWMSKSLRAKTLRDGTPLKLYNKQGEMGLIFGNYNDDNLGELAPGYMYCHDKIDGNSTFDPANNMTSEEREKLRIPALYNYSAFEHELMTPLSPESHYVYHAPYIQDMDKVMHYFGYVFSAKMSTKGVWEGVNNQNIPNLSESKLQSLINGEWTSSNCDLYCSNISGFNLMPMGLITNDLTDKGGTPGVVAALLLLTRDRDLGVSYASFNSWNCWSSSEFAGFYPSQSKYVYPSGAWAREECISRVCAQIRYFMRFKNQQDAAYYGEGGTDFARSLGTSIKKSIKSPSGNQESKHNGNVVYIQLKR